MTDVKLGYIGLGNMGAPMAMRLTDWPGGFVVFDVRAEAMTPFVEAGAQAADGVAERRGGRHHQRHGAERRTGPRGGR